MDELYVWDETHATNNFAIMTKLILHYVSTCSSLNIADTFLGPTDINPCSVSLYAHITIRSFGL